MKDGAVNSGTLPGRAVVTGATGFIGSHLTRRLTEAGTTVVALSRGKASGGAATSRLVADLNDPEAVAAAVAEAQPEVVFHLASAVTGNRALDAVWPTLTGNAVSTVAVLQAAARAGVRRVVLAGSMEEPRDDAIPASPYAAAKQAARIYADLFRASYGLEVVHLRIFMVYGPGQEDRTKLVPASALALSQGIVPDFGSGERRVDWIHVSDVVEALVAAAAIEPAPKVPVDVGSGTPTTIRSVVEAIGRLAGCDPSDGFGRLPDRPREVEPIADVAASQRLLGWSPRVALHDGLAETVDWYTARR